MTDDFASLTSRAQAFTAARGWQRFHDPKSLILALTGEVGELAELFQWVDAAGAREEVGDPARKQRAAEEMSDVLIYLVHLANTLDIDLLAASHAKLTDSEARFPPTEKGPTPAPRKA